MRILRSPILTFVSLLLSLLVAVSVHGQSAPLASWAEPRLSGTVDESLRVTLRGNRPPQARAELDAGAVDPSLTLEHVVLVLQPSASQQKALDELLRAQQDSTSPLYHQWLTPEQFGEHFGVAQSDLDRIESWLAGHGLAVEEVAPSRRSLTFRGTAAQVQSAFATSLRHYRVSGQLHMANSVEPSIPAAFSGVVGGVLSLHDFRARSALLGEARPVGEYTSGSAHYVTPGDLATIYNVSPLYSQGINGSGQSVAVVARSNINLSDIQTFRSTFGLATNAPQIILTGKDPGTANLSELIEATLDAEYAGSLAPLATVKFVSSASTATTDGVGLSAQYIVNNNLAPLMTTSFGLCEQQMGASGNAFYNALWQQAAAQGITVLVSSGDSGAAGCDGGSSTKASNGAGVNGLCSSPYSLCVGGTQFSEGILYSLYWAPSNGSGNSSALSYIPEAVWNESGGGGLWASGGGASTIYPKPAWQSGPGVPADGHRDVPDLSLTAAGHDGYLIVANGSTYSVGGTSASSPTLASMLALLVAGRGTRLGAPHAALYSLAAQQGSGFTIFHDITTGSNGVPGQAGFAATTGYDAATGLGSVDATSLVTHWSAGQISSSLMLSLASAGLTIAPGKSSSTTLKTTVAGGFNASVTLSVTGLPKGITATLSPASIAAPGSGSSTLQVSVASTVAAGVYTFSVLANGGGDSKTASLSVTVPAAGLTLATSSGTVSILPGGSGTVTITSTGLNGLNSSVALSLTGLPLGVTASPAALSIAAPGSGSISIKLAVAASTTPGSYVVVVSGKAGMASASTQITLNVPALAMSASSTGVTVMRGATASVTVSTRGQGGFSSPVTISATGLPANVTVSAVTIAAPGTGSVALTFSATSKATAQSSKISLIATGGGLSTAVPFTLTVK